jgi:hypothetical protein
VRPRKGLFLFEVLTLNLGLGPAASSVAEQTPWRQQIGLLGDLQGVASRMVASKLLYGQLFTVPVPDVDAAELVVILGANPFSQALAAAILKCLVCAADDLPQGVSHERTCHRGISRQHTSSTVRTHFVRSS